MDPMGYIFSLKLTAKAPDVFPFGIKAMIFRRELSVLQRVHGNSRRNGGRFTIQNPFFGKQHGNRKYVSTMT